MKREFVDWKLRPLRRRLSLPAMGRSASAGTFKLMLSNISYEGCHVLAEATLAVGEVIEVDVPSMGLMRAQVRWSSEDQAGLRFLLGQSEVENRRARIGV